MWEETRFQVQVVGSIMLHKDRIKDSYSNRWWLFCSSVVWLLYSTCCFILCLESEADKHLLLWNLQWTDGRVGMLNKCNLSIMFGD